MRGSRQRGRSIKGQSHSQGPGWLERMEHRGHGQRGPEPAPLGLSPPHGAHPSRLGLHTEGQQRGTVGGLSVFCHMECPGRYGGQLEG